MAYPEKSTEFGPVLKRADVSVREAGRLKQLFRIVGDFPEA